MLKKCVGLTLAGHKIDIDPVLVRVQQMVVEGSSCGGGDLGPDMNNACRRCGMRVANPRVTNHLNKQRQQILNKNTL